MSGIAYYIRHYSPWIILLLIGVIAVLAYLLKDVTDKTKQLDEIAKTLDQRQAAQTLDTSSLEECKKSYNKAADLSNIYKKSLGNIQNANQAAAMVMYKGIYKIFFAPDIYFRFDDQSVSLIRITPVDPSKDIYTVESLTTITIEGIEPIVFYDNDVSANIIKIKTTQAMDTKPFTNRRSAFDFPGHVSLVNLFDGPEALIQVKDGENNIRDLIQKDNNLTRLYYNGKLV